MDGQNFWVKKWRAVTCEYFWNHYWVSMHQCPVGGSKNLEMTYVAGLTVVYKAGG